METHVLNTQALFLLLLKALHPDLVCDVGAHNGHHSMLFRQTLPQTTILAFEANRFLYELLQQDTQIRNAGIKLFNQAVWNSDEELSFYETPIQSAEGLSDPISGMSSLLVLNKQVSMFQKACSVSATRLDSFIRKLESQPTCIALWIDVEGAAYEVLEGLAEIHHRVAIVHVEVETEEVWQDQRLGRDVIELMQSFSFTPVAKGEAAIQHDIVFLAEWVTQQHRQAIQAALRTARFATYMRRLLGTSLFRKVAHHYLVHS